MTHQSMQEFVQEPVSLTASHHDTQLSSTHKDHPVTCSENAALTEYDVEINLEEQLILSVQWLLKQSCSPHFTAHARMKMLDRAWCIQKRVWEMRHAQIDALIHRTDSALN